MHALKAVGSQPIFLLQSTLQSAFAVSADLEFERPAIIMSKVSKEPLFDQHQTQLSHCADPLKAVTTYSHASQKVHEQNDYVTNKLLGLLNMQQFALKVNTGHRLT